MEGFRSQRRKERGHGKKSKKITYRQDREVFGRKLGGRSGFYFFCCTFSLFGGTSKTESQLDLWWCGICAASDMTRMY